MAALEELRPDVIVSDIGMPGEDGYDFIAKVRSLGPSNPLSGVAAIALTAYARAEDRRRALAAGFQMHVAKPIVPADIIEVVRRFSR